MSAPALDTIAAVATAPGRAGVGIVRVSGPQAETIARQMLGFKPQPRYAHYGPFRDTEGQELDEGIALFFPGPHSFTGEDVLELQGHGGPIVMDLLLNAVCASGARLARPGEFSERAFLNDKMDLAQAEAIADLIDSSSEQAARCAVRSLQGEFSRRILSLVDRLIALRIYVEAAIDFPEEEIDFLADGKVATDIEGLLEELDGIAREARQGSLLREGMNVVIAGRPNAGKSSLLNALAGREAAIVTAVEGTTRDVLREHIHIDGMPLHIVDTAGLRYSSDEVERIGIERAWNEIDKADRILLLIDSVAGPDAGMSGVNVLDAVWQGLDVGIRKQLPPGVPVTLVRNKTDQSGEAPGLTYLDELPVLRLSAKTGEGLEALRAHLKASMGFEASLEGGFLARRRHLDALERARSAVTAGQAQLAGTGAGELLAEDLRVAQECLGEITGTVTPDELLGHIFSSFCIGK
ncbi:tRNA uridine-5-carboxymethylaminomethyl(34) synthesis GTPase MnmE [Hydrocarboniclastica marina]|uniref:tRNA modification GTPase MnmE n=1 Tax=Hydrocarboniclastica marina TaxID=2259620 RepID=A0A4P7XEG0_9ALTE|nr:tRNA uridine-5-carboxymethylaminomethyl(34) synthesis GTPase MnmE [Hydrocarboniclastica marina]MAM00455.1 tRNA uridine-5-carboxymethylaminomethyl(34) synthesis GTPase MnmE [Alteromonadaceae bacterium]QCF24472.1 tRNA uridine-5-carboxymethylaminomethyl(34) synthesis GTPase MnmE [Hydrocarboniclastica marina]